MISKKAHVCGNVLASCAGCGAPYSLQSLSLCEINGNIVFFGKHLFA